MSEGWPIGTDAVAHIKVIEKLFQSGTTMVNIHAGQSDQIRVIEFYKDKIIPQLKSRSRIGMNFRAGKKATLSTCSSIEKAPDRLKYSPCGAVPRPPSEVICLSA